MKKLVLLICLSLAVAPVFAQEYREETEKEEKVSLTVGLLQGGGSLLGANLEFLLSRHIGVQLGAGFVGYGAGLNVHLKPSIRSSFVSLTYWHQGIGASHSQSVLGPSFVYRSKKWFTAQLGVGFPLEKGPAWPVEMEHPPVILLYSIGAYFPW